jgi:hypothetical protein
MSRKKERLASQNREEESDGSAENSAPLTPARDRDVLCRYVVNRTGKQIGETLSTYEEKIVLKQKNQYLVIPLHALEQTENNLELKLNEDEIDWKAAKELGKEWYKTYFNPLGQRD